MNDIAIFETDNHQVEVRLQGETVWLSLQQFTSLFGRDKSGSCASATLKNIWRALDDPRS